jgi:dephospho-CoA kinase
LAGRIIGLTGGIATGKSTVGRILGDLGIPLADADVLARAAVAPGSEILAALAARYGPGILDAAGGLDRPALARIVFADPQERRWVEEQIHPRVRRDLMAFCTRQEEAPCLCLVVPLLFEAGMTDLVDEIWVVVCSPERQRRRLAERDGLSSKEIERRIASQWPLERKTSRATVILDNDGQVEALVPQVHRALARRHRLP